MTKKFLWMALILAVLLAFSTVAFAQEDDDASDDDATGGGTFQDSIVTFTNPTTLEADSTYQFEFEVFNAAEAEAKKGIWIKKVEIVLPVGGYVLAPDGEQPAAPDCLNAGDFCELWEAMFDSTNNTITWQSFGMVTTVEYGDIREQDVQTFAFIATTDAGPSDGFAWTLWGDDENFSFVEGIWNFFGDDDTGPDDDDFEPDDDTSDQGDDDDDSGGCGC